MLFAGLLVSVLPVLYAQQPELQVTYLSSIPDPERNILYDPERPLTMADFMGSPDPSSEAVAITSSGFRFNAGYRRSGGKATIQLAVYCSFDKQESWMKEKGKDPHVLAHEQHHFDISYLHTLKFMQRVKRLQLGSQGFMEQIREVYDQTVAELQEMQNRYDRETSHGIFKEEQLAWNKRIGQEVNSLSKKVR